MNYNEEFKDKLDILRIALEIERTKALKKVVYVDVGDLTKNKAAEYMTLCSELINNDPDGNYTLPRREGGRGTEIQIIDGPISEDAVLATATKLEAFCCK